MIQSGDGGEDFAHFTAGQDHGQFELALGADQDQFVRPLPAEGLFPEHFDGADGLGGGLTGHRLDVLEMNEVLAELFGAEWIGGQAVMVAELDDAGVIGFLRALGEGQQREVIGEGV